jgi:hypothetical protein
MEDLDDNWDEVIARTRDLQAYEDIDYGPHARASGAQWIRYDNGTIIKDIDTYGVVRLLLFENCPYSSLFYGVGKNWSSWERPLCVWVDLDSGAFGLRLVWSWSHLGPDLFRSCQSCTHSGLAPSGPDSFGPGRCRLSQLGSSHIRLCPCSL